MALFSGNTLNKTARIILVISGFIIFFESLSLLMSTSLQSQSWQMLKAFLFLFSDIIISAVLVSLLFTRINVEHMPFFYIISALLAASHIIREAEYLLKLNAPFLSNESLFLTNSIRTGALIAGVLLLAFQCFFQKQKTSLSQ